MARKVEDVMATRPRGVTPSTPLSEAAQLMAAEDVGSLPIVEGDRLVAMITDRDIVIRAVAQGKDPRGMPVREIASSDLVTIRPDQDVGDAAEMMAQHQVRRLPVVDEDDRLVGIVSQADIALEVKEKAAGAMLEDISRPPAGPRT